MLPDRQPYLMPRGAHFAYAVITYRRPISARYTELTLMECQTWRSTVAQTMTAAVVRFFVKPLIIEEVPVPTPGRGKFLVKVASYWTSRTRRAEEI